MGISMLILTDFDRFPKQWKVGAIDGQTSTALAGSKPLDFWRLIPEFRRADLILVGESPFKALWVILLRSLLFMQKKPIVCVDLVMRKPKSAKQRLFAAIKKRILNHADHFINYFWDLREYDRIYGISPERSSYVPFKANLFGDPRLVPASSTQKEEFVFMAGWSLRDYDTFFDAIAPLHYPAAIPQPDFSMLRTHGSRFTWTVGQLPRHLMLLPHTGDRDSWLRILCRAKVVVVPMLKETISAGGISVYLDAMLLGKCVILSAVPGVGDVLKDEALVVPPEDPAALRTAIQKVWEDDPLRAETARRGQAYATALGGEPELLQRILEATVRFSRGVTNGSAA
jgi:glycosyltransferase involved in cell wall biosynthesis